MQEEHHFLVELFPEIAGFFKKLNIRAIGVNVLTEFEKLLRQFRLVALRFDTLTHKAINKVRKSTKEHEKILQEQKENGEDPSVSDSLFPENGNLDLKQEEQRLIIEIAKNPKDADLYKELGILYMKTGDLEDARHSFIKAEELNPADDDNKRRLDRVKKILEKIPSA